MTQSVFQSHQKVRAHGKELKHPAISQTSCNSGKTLIANTHTVQNIITVQVNNDAHKNISTFCLSSFSCSCAFFLLRQSCLHSNSTVHGLPDRKELSTPPHRSCSIPWKCHQTVYICVSSLAVWILDTVSPCPTVIQLSTTSVIHGHNVFSVFLKQMSLKTFFMTHTTYTPSSAWKYHSHTHNTALSKTIAPGNWGILTRNKAKMNLGNENFP